MRINMRVGDEFFERLKAAAAKEDVSYSEYIRAAIDVRMGVHTPKAKAVHTKSTPVHTNEGSKAEPVHTSPSSVHTNDEAAPAVVHTSDVPVPDPVHTPAPPARRAIVRSIRIAPVIFTQSPEERAAKLSQLKPTVSELSSVPK